MAFDSALAWRGRVLRGVIVLVFGIIVVNLCVLMIVRHERYRAQALDNRQVSFRMRAPRGRILDRLGQTIADNRFYADITVSPSSLKDSRPDSTLDRLLTWFSLPRAETLADLAKQKERGRGRLVLVPDASMARIAAVEERRADLPGVQVESRLVRRYLFGQLFAHLVGYVGEVDQAEIAKAPLELDYKQGDFVGKQGVEAAFEKGLRGSPGLKLEEVNASGRIVGRESVWLRQVVAGEDLQLSVSVPLQMEMSRLLAGRPGCGIAIAIPSGEVLAAASSPTFDPNIMLGSLSEKDWRALADDPTKPFFNRILQATYPPGSLYKPVTSLAALRAGVIDTGTTLVPCSGGYRFGNRVFRCWDHGGHGSLDLTGALAHSCDVYYYQVGLKLDIDTLHEAARFFGLGSPCTGVFREESGGNVPTTAWYDERFGKGGWNRSVMLNNAIGQGELLVTPLQMALLAARIASDGRVTGPVFVHEGTALKEAPLLPFSRQDLAWCRHALRRVVDAGTGGAVRVAGVPVAGKTGTAQNSQGNDHAWFMCFAPADAPEVAVAVILENAGHGGSQAGPVVGEWLKYYFEHGPDAPAIPDSTVVPDTTGGVS
jgi:penicillin-binding protein 2